jgi:hypothetical protein
MHIANDNYYTIKLDFKFYRLYIIWISDEIDEVLVNNDQKVIAFKSEDLLLECWQKHISKKYNEPTTYSIYKLQQWLINPHFEFDGNEFLNLWNLFTDLSESVKKVFIGDIKDEVRKVLYDKLFDTSGLFIVEDPNPEFSTDEINLLSEVMQNGLDLLLNNLIIVENENAFL